MADFSDSLRRARIAAGLTQKDAADWLGVSQVTWCRYETGEHMPAIKHLRKIVTRFGISTDGQRHTPRPVEGLPRDFGKRLKAARRAMGLSGNQAAARCKVHRNQWYRWERGVNEPTPEAYAKVLKLVGEL